MNLDTPILTFKNSGIETKWCLREACQSIFVTGGLGSGKSTGSKRLIAAKYLSMGFSGIILTAKISERQEWEELAELTGRTKDLIIVTPGGQHQINFLDYELKQSIDADGATDNIVHLLNTVIAAGMDKNNGGNDDSFWISALTMLITYSIEACKLAFGKLKIDDLYRFVQAIPRAETIASEYKKYQEEEKKNVSSTQLNPFFHVLNLAGIKADESIKLYKETLSPRELLELENSPRHDLTLEDKVRDWRMYVLVEEFFTKTYTNLSDKTRSIIDFSFSGFLFHFMREPIYSIFCKDSTFSPEDTFNGKIIIIDLPVKKYHKAGQDAQTLLKLIWQRAVEKRHVTDNSTPLFLFADESQFFVTSTDTDFQTTARSSKVSVVYITQNLSNFYANMGGEKSEHKVKSLLGCFGTHIFHNNSDIETNKYASELIGDALFQESTKSENVGNETVNLGVNSSYKYERQLRPEEFSKLRTGGPLNDYKVEGILHCQGNFFPTAKNYQRIIFDQKYIPVKQLKH